MENEAFTVAETKRREGNARKARELADKEFPGEEWIFVENGIYLSPRRPIGAKSNYKDELLDARILRDLGSTVYLCPENRYIAGRKYNAIVDGQKTVFKNIGGNANTLENQFLKSRSQAANVFINLDESDLTKREIIDTLSGARHNAGRYAIKNRFSGGKIILKIKGRDTLIHLNVDKLKTKRQKDDGHPPSKTASH
jgi:hypothetical protein